MNFPLLGQFYQHLLFFLPFVTEPFNYDDPNKWSQDFPQCRGFRQSPIAINTHKAFIVNLPPLLFGSYDALFQDLPDLHNNGHTIEFEVPVTFTGERPFITGALLEEIYEAQMVHFHWGSPTQKGSEHMLNGKRYDLEMHIVHKNAKYPSIEVARNYEDGLAVIAVLFNVVKAHNVYYPGLNEIYRTLEHLNSFNASASTTLPITLDSLFGSIDLEDFFIYKGSLTTPPCSEAVTWIVFSQVVPISHIELPKFWSFHDSRGRKVRNNFRPLQPAKYRKVYHRTSTSNAIFGNIVF